MFDERIRNGKNYVTDLPDVSEKYLLDSNEPTTVIFNKSKNIDSYPKVLL